jgi:hypothetical protein
VKPPSTIAGSLLFSPGDTAKLVLGAGTGLWLNMGAPAFSLDLPAGSTGATILLAGTATLTETAASGLTAERLLLLGNAATHNLAATTANRIGTLAASTGAVSFADGGPGTAVDLRTGSIFGVAGVQSTGAVSLSAGGKLTLAAGAPVSGSGAGTAVTLVAGGAFVNEGGAGAIRPGDSGRFLVYSQDPANDTRGGLVYAFKQYNATLGSTVLGTGDGFLYSVAPLISVTAVTKVYDGTTALPAGPGGITATGAIDGDTVTTLSAAGSYDTKNAGPGKTVTLTGLGIAGGTDATGAQVFGYQLAPVAPLNTIGTINKAPLTVTAAANTKTYDGTVAAAALPTIAAGALATGDLATLSETYATRNAGTGLTLNPAAVIADGNGGANYSVTLVSGTLGTINKAPLTVTAAANTKTYDGTVTAAALPTITAGALATGDTATLSETYASRNAGAGLTLNPAAVIADGNNGANYAVTLVSGTLGTIAKAPLTVTAAANTKTYEGTVAAAALPTITAGALATGDTATLSETYAARNAGAGLTLNPAAVIADGNDGANYAVTLVSGTVGTILPAALTVIAGNASRDFGQPNPPLTGTLSGLVGGDTAELIGLSFATAATPASPPGSYPVTAVIASTNYLERLVPGILTVNLRTLAAQPITVAASLAQASVQQADQLQDAEQPRHQRAKRQTEAPALRPGSALPIVQSYDAKVTAPRQALFVVLPNADGTVGAISVDDGHSVTTLDRPYAAAQMRQGEAAAAEVGPDEVKAVFGGAVGARAKAP